MDPNANEEDESLAVVVAADSSSSGSSEDENQIQNGIMHDFDEEAYSTSSSSSLSSIDRPASSPRPASNRTSSTSSHHSHHLNVSYDMRLPIQHSYLGSDLNELSGRVVLEDDSITTIALLSLPGVILVPGQILPMQIQHPTLIAIVRKIIESNRSIFGLTSSSTANEGNRLGTTAEIRCFSVQEDVLKMKAEGRQVFLIQDTWRGVDGILMGRVQILPQVDISHPGQKHCLSSSHGSRFNGQLLPVCTPIPSFVYDMYDPKILRDRILSYLGNWMMREEREEGRSREMRVTTTMINALGEINEGEEVDEEEEEEALEFERQAGPSASSLRGSFSEMNASPSPSSSSASLIPESPSLFSFWVAGNLPLDDHLLLQFLSLTCHVQRLRWLLSLLSRCLYITCLKCKSKVCRKEDVFCMSLKGPQGTYVNPSGFVHETITVFRAEGLSLIDEPSTEFSWFPGYAWTICNCSRCGSHIGWKFTTAKDQGLKPEFFWGLTRSSIQLSFRREEEGNQDNFRPVI